MNHNYYQNTSPDYYNYENNSYNQPSFNQSPTAPKLYDPYNGYIRGNLFPTLYNSYKVESPFPINPDNEQADLLTYLNAIEFAAHELNLYLDNFPDNCQLISLRNEYVQEGKKIKQQYERAYGPLSVDSEVTGKCPWTWNKAPWPWENK